MAIKSSKTLRNLRVTCIRIYQVLKEIEKKILFR